MAKFNVLAWVTVGGQVQIEAETAEQAKQKVSEIIAENEMDFINHKTINVGHREYEVIQVEKV